MSAPTTIATVSHDGRSRFERDTLRATAEVGEAVAGVSAALLDGDRDLAAVVSGRAALVVLECRAIEDALLTGGAGADAAVLLGAGRIAADLAATAALVRDIAATVPRVPSPSLPPRVRGLLGRLGEETRQLLVTATHAWSPIDHGRLACEPRGAVLDDLHRRLLAELFSGAVPLATAVELTLVGRHFERLAGHAVALADHVRTVSRSAP